MAKSSRKEINQTEPTTGAAARAGRERLILHGAIELETGMTSVVDVLTIDAQSTVGLFEALEPAYPNMCRSTSSSITPAITTTNWSAIG